MNQNDLDYERAYETYKLLPIIAGLGFELLTIVWGILDAICWFTSLADTSIVAIIVWPLIGIPVSLLIGFVTMVTISPTVLRTDAALRIARTVENDKININTNNQNDESEHRSYHVKESTPKVFYTKTETSHQNWTCKCGATNNYQSHECSVCFSTRPQN